MKIANVFKIAIHLKKKKEQNRKRERKRESKKRPQILCIMYACI